jgi:Ca2+-binding EF-hand superfamily protein
MDDINRLRVGKYSELRNASEIQDLEAHQMDANVLREVFEAADTDRNGVIDMHELGQLLKDVNMSTFQYSFSAYDDDGNGMLDFDEFTRFYQDSLHTWLRGKDSKQIMRKHFEVRWSQLLLS